MADITRKRSRERLAVRREPYWQRLAEGAYLGFRRGPDTWIARYRNRNGKQSYHALAGAVEYDDAKRAAEAWLQQLGSTAVRSARRGTVREALEHYLEWLREQGRDSTATTCEQRFKAIVWNDPIAELSLESLTRDDMREWRERLRPGRQPRSINRHVRSIVAALNRAHEDGHVGNPAAWKLPPLADDIEDDGETAVILTAEQRAALIKAASPHAAAFLRGLELTGARPKELAAATVADYDVAHGTLKLSHRKGRPAKLRTRIVVLSAAGAKFFRSQARDKLPGAFLFPDEDGKQWRREYWAWEVRQAIEKHNAAARGKQRIPSTASAYSFRHARISELLQVHGVDPLTVAVQTGTSIAMIEKAYYSFIPSAMREKLAAIEER
jgi:integrase